MSDCKHMAYERPNPRALWTCRYCGKRLTDEQVRAGTRLAQIAYGAHGEPDPLESMDVPLDRKPR